MSARRRKKSQSEKKIDRAVDIHEFAKGMKSGDLKMIGKDTYVFPIFALDVPEPIKKNAKPKAKKK